ncbi:MAG TPA: TetR/AcrR family transcriptional regulator [Ktedonobacteraceae bacterium]|nr:TetR/AcrR family transcriptional regulator [Ktedonobacteraceae bacterium]
MNKTSRERDAEVARETILSAAEAVFAREGFDGARIDVIASESGYNKSLIFHYFDDKEGLYRASVARLKQRMRSEVFEPMQAFVESSDEMNVTRVSLFLEMAIDRYLVFLTQHPRNLRMMAWEAAEGWHIFMGEPKKELERHKISLLCVADFLQLAQKAGIINPKLNIRMLLMSLANLCVVHLLNLPRYQGFLEEKIADFSSPDSLAYIRQQIVQLVLHGILASPGGGTST